MVLSLFVAPKWHKSASLDVFSAFFDLKTIKLWFMIFGSSCQVYFLEFRDHVAKHTLKRWCCMVGIRLEIEKQVVPASLSECGCVPGCRMYGYVEILLDKVFHFLYYMWGTLFSRFYLKNAGKGTVHLFSNMGWCKSILRLHTVTMHNLKICVTIKAIWASVYL